MEIRISSNQVLRILQVISWIIFIALLVDAGGIIFNVIFTFAYNSDNTEHFWGGANLKNLYEYDHGQYVVIGIYMGIVTVLKAIMFYVIVRFLSSKKLIVDTPFNPALRKFVLILSYISIGIGIFAHMGVNYSKWLAGKGVSMPDSQLLKLGGADVWFLMAVTLIVIAQILKKGIKIQTENDLTI